MKFHILVYLTRSSTNTLCDESMIFKHKFIVNALRLLKHDITAKFSTKQFTSVTVTCI